MEVKLNVLLCGDRCPLEIFLGRPVSYCLPNTGGKVLDLMRYIEGRRRVQANWMKRLGRVYTDQYEVGYKITRMDIGL